MSTAETEVDVVNVGHLEPGSQATLKRDARRLAQRFRQVSLLGVDRQSLDRLDPQRAILNQAYTIFHQQAQNDQLAGQQGEWLLDNYHVISNALRQIEQDMPHDYYRQLPRIMAGDWCDYPRVYLLARELLAGQPMRLEMEWAKQFLIYYQEITPLSMGELWALPTMLRFNIIERLIQSLAPTTEQAGVSLPDLADVGSAAADSIVPWCISGLRTLDIYNWKTFFEEVNLVDQILAQDPAAVYQKMDFDTRDLYRKVVERFSRATSWDEMEVASQAVSLAHQVELGQGPPLLPASAAHVGYYLIDNGLPYLEQALAYRAPWRMRLRRWWLQRHPTLLYLGCVASLTLLLYLVPLAYLLQVTTSSVAILAVSLLLIVPLLTMAVNLANWLMTLLVKPRVLPKLAFEDGVPASRRTMVVMPTLLSDDAEVEALLQKLELHYLRNQDPHIAFALLTDFCDAPQQQMPQDELLLSQVSQGIQRLNQRYGQPAELGPFYLFHRQRLWNAREGFWMGWERKRGKLEEFNALLLGDNTTSYTTQIGYMAILPQIRYVITLDVDTTLPRGQAKHLVGTLAHPLNQARLDGERGIVTSGYTVLQPRVEIKPSSTNYSAFSRIFGGQSGLDLYSLPVSDMYHDLFGEGIYMGKGIYEVALFRRCLAERVPENTLLSHDLFEGLHGRTGLVSDVIVYEEFPPSFQAYARRAHRWIRGDWQLLPWLLPWVPHVRDGKTRNELHLIDRWKIIDNLRRSLLRPVLMLILVAGWLWLPGSPAVWTLLAALTLASDLFIALIDRLVHSVMDAVRFDANQTIQKPLLRWLLELVALPYQAMIACDAIITVMLRMFITRKRLLQWTTAAHTVQLLGRKQSINVVWREVSASSLLALALVVLVAIFNWTALPVAAPLLLAWLVGPQIMLTISRPQAPAEESLNSQQRRQLRCLTRRTWYFFEQFVGPEDHWLAPDHFQETPRGLVAHRTSPTNIGLMLLATLAAYDMGYLGLPELQVRLQNTLENLEKLERFWGHFLNWYDTSTLAPLPPCYISTVDSGNLACCLVALRQNCLAVPDIYLPRPERRRGFLDTLAVLEEILAPLAPAAPERVHAFQGCLDSIVSQLQVAGEDPRRWSSLLTSLKEVTWPLVDQELVSLLNEGQLDPATLHSVRVWSDRARHQLFDMQRKVHMMMPWLAFVPDAPKLLQSSEAGSELGAAWRALTDILPFERAPCREISAICHAAQMQLAEILLLLPDAPADPEMKEAARQWCLQFGQALSAAEAEVTQLLGSFAELGQTLERLIAEMDFTFLYNHERGVFHIGYNVDSESRDANCYDLLASEARLASLLAIAKGDVPEHHWLYLGRPLTQAKGGLTLLSWSGTMFEYLMPSLLAREHPDTLLNQSVYNSIDHQIDYGRQKGVPWGISESGYYRFDANLNYQYRAFGVPGLGFKRGLGDDLVVSPYASMLALPFRPQAVFDNIARFNEMKMIGDYGFYEAVDFTPSRLALGEEWAIIRSFMIHHQGMIMLSLVNTLLDKPMIRRFHADLQIRSVELLLQERLPSKASNVGVPEQEVTLAGAVRSKQLAVTWNVPVNTANPWVHYLANGRYGVLLTNSGAGYSRWQETDLTRWSADTTRDDWGTWIYIQDRESGQLWSTTPQPTNNPDSRWEIAFAPHQVNFHCTASGISSLLEITVPPGEDAEIRRVRLTNHGLRSRRLALISYGELVLCEQNADRRHPAFNKLFIESEYLPQKQILLFRRRPREGHESPLYMAHAVVTQLDPSSDVTFESSREQFLKRGGSPRQPEALCAGADGLSGSAGCVLDPIMCLQVCLEIEPHSTVEVAFLTLAGGSREQLLSLVEHYRRPGQIATAFDRALAHSELELHQLNLTSIELSHYQKLLSLLIYPHSQLRPSPEELAQNRLDQSALWPYAISGDFPILLVSLETDEELGLLRDLLQAHRYWRHRGLKIDLVIMNAQGTSYDQALQDQLHRQLQRTHGDQWLNRPGGIFVVQADRLSPAHQLLFAAAARVVLRGQAGNLARQLAREYAPPAWPPQFVPPRITRPPEPTPPLARPDLLLDDNGWGGFGADGREYLIYLQSEKRTPAPWVNIISNCGFGFLVSETGSSFTWAVNSGENRLTPWHNDPVRDPTGEALYLRDEATGLVWSPTPQPLPAAAPYLIRHGAGYTIFEHHSHGLKQTLRLFVDVVEPVKLISLRLENTWGRPRVLALTYYCEWVLGVNRDRTQQYLIPEYDSQTGALLARQPYEAEFGHGVAFLVASQNPDNLTADRTEFLGRLGDLSKPVALKRVGLTGRVMAGSDPCAALQLLINLNAEETKEFHFVLGQGKDRSQALTLIGRFRDPAQVDTAWQAVHDQWEKLLGAVQVETPDKQMDMMLNRWLPYQNLSCRIWGRSGLYQSSGAYGFRDQLQDVMAVLHSAPEEARQQILRAASRQFEAGDVLHWWHPPSGRGVRTRISDDLLWLPYATAEYVTVTQDETIWHQSVSFLQAPSLADDELERYGHYEASTEPASLYEHCCRAIERADRSGVHGLPLMGAGDWNDGLNRVGIAGRGESIWLGWFLYATLARFIPICQRLGDESRAERYRQRMSQLRFALEDHGWDGEWYLRAYCDDGHLLGSQNSLECRISSIAQSWAVLSGASGGQRTQQAINSLWKHLVRPAEQLVLLFSPPFGQADQDPGYIRGYPPGVRENGGQYTHAATWAAWACAYLGRGSDAHRLFQMLNPINHADTQAKAQQYRVEPYVVAADIYGMPPHCGRGGWTWYTGSAGWLYRLGLEAILGVCRQGPALRLAPCIPETWLGFRVVYQIGQTTYRIDVSNPERLNQGVKQVFLDGRPLPDGLIPLVDDGLEHRAQVLMGR
jgi:cyclic beta-1,2-glucan synthetase